MYPLDMKLPAPKIGFAVANDEDEHQTLSSAGYTPGYVAPFSANAETDASGRTVESVRAQLDAAGIEYDKRNGLAKLITLLPA